MKGKLHKTEQGWVISKCVGDGVAEVWEEQIPLHPDDVKQINRDAQVFDNIEARIRAYPDVEFHEIEECPHYGGKHFGIDCSCKTGFIKYAKLNQHSDT